MLSHSSSSVSWVRRTTSSGKSIAVQSKKLAKYDIQFGWAVVVRVLMPKNIDTAKVARMARRVWGRFIASPKPVRNWLFMVCACSC